MSYAKILSSTSTKHSENWKMRLCTRIFACVWVEEVIWQHRDSVNFVFDLPNAIAEQELSKGRNLSSALAPASRQRQREPCLYSEPQPVFWRMWLHRLGLYLSLTFQVSNVKLCRQLVPTHPIGPAQAAAGDINLHSSITDQQYNLP